MENNLFTIETYKPDFVFKQQPYLLIVRDTVSGAYYIRVANSTVVEKARLIYNWVAGIKPKPPALIPINYLERTNGGSIKPNYVFEIVDPYSLAYRRTINNPVERERIRDSYTDTLGVRDAFNHVINTYGIANYVYKAGAAQRPIFYQNKFYLNKVNLERIKTYYNI